MAPTLLQKLFSKKASSTGGARDCRKAADQCWATAEFDLAQIRLIVYQDCERRGRQVLFDSKAIQKLDPLKQQNAEETKAPPSKSGTCQISSRENQKETQPIYQYTRPASDVNMLGEMMFGSVAMSYKGSTLKIHHIRSPPQLMVSKVFSTRYGSSNTGSTTTLQDSFESLSQTCPSHSSSIGVPGSGVWRLYRCTVTLGYSLGSTPQLLSESASFFAAHSNPVDMPGRGCSEDGDSGIARSASLSSLLATPLPSPGSSSSSGCASSYQRRWLRSQATSLQHGPIPRCSTEEMFSLSDESCGSNPGVGRRKKIAVSIIISLPEKEEESISFQGFFFSHFPLFESHMNKLKGAIERAMIVCRRVAEASQRVQVYLCRVMEALGEFRMTVWNLYMAPRITEPVWLTMVSQSAERNPLCQRFLKEMSLLMEHGAKNQFLSALLTAVLMYHLAWVPTVMPSNHLPIKPVCQKHASPTVDLLAKSHPYNALWAQLGDLYGALGSPVRVCRTVVVGRRRELVQRVLYVMSYFIRCSDLQENTQPQGQMDSPANPCPAQPSNPIPCPERTSEKPLTTPGSGAVKPDIGPERTNEKMLRPDLDSAVPFMQSERATVTADTTPFPQMTSDMLEGAEVGLECFGESNISVGVGLEHILASQSPPVHRVQFTIGSPKERKNDGQLRDLVRTGCGQEVHRKLPHRILTDIQRNTSLDSSLGDSDEEESTPQRPYKASEMQEYEVPLLSCPTECRPSLNHFGRSLLGGYCPQYMPDFALHGVSSDHHLRQCLPTDLEHTVLHPALDEPVAEAVCIVADTDRLCVQLATSQHRMCETSRFGKDVMVSSLVHALLVSTLQLHALNVAADFCVMHLEDRLQELYFKSCSLAEYLRGQSRANVKELTLTLGIESNDLPLLTAVASTHSPYVAQILL
ncbi:folliculin-interacting protein 2 isoform X3 [Electrophorus electricus]|uniref:folliculin-interacting protein 2 isoform X3 n=1 Tax=Electrophorus electricus TaxID=8005 RepID=UPI0015CF8FE1|nr:folliculin-interacting protein 2 isoform X3 [Electrophorus electricus]